MAELPIGPFATCLRSFSPDLADNYFCHTAPSPVEPDSDLESVGLWCNEEEEFDDIFLAACEQQAPNVSPLDEEVSDDTDTNSNASSGTFIHTVLLNIHLFKSLFQT